MTEKKETQNKNCRKSITENLSSLREIAGETEIAQKSLAKTDLVNDCHQRQK